MVKDLVCVRVQWVKVTALQVECMYCVCLLDYEGDEDPWIVDGEFGSEE